MWHVFERSWIRPRLLTSVKWLSANLSDLYSRIIQYESRLQPLHATLSTSKPLWNSIVTQATAYFSPSFQYLIRINAIRAGLLSASVNNKQMKCYSPCTVRSLYSRKDNRAHCWYRTPDESTTPFLVFIVVWVNLLICPSNSEHGRKLHVAFGNRRRRMIGFMFW